MCLVEEIQRRHAQIAGTAEEELLLADNMTLMQLTALRIRLIMSCPGDVTSKLFKTSKSSEGLTLS